MDPRFQAWLLRDEAAKEQQIGDSYADTAPDVAYAHRALAAAMRAGAEALAPLVPPASGVAQPATNVVAEKLPANPDPPIEASDALRLQPPPDNATAYDATMQQLRDALESQRLYPSRVRLAVDLRLATLTLGGAKKPTPADPPASLTATGEDHKSEKTLRAEEHKL
jgi:hypothetical protein